MAKQMIAAKALMTLRLRPSHTQQRSATQGLPMDGKSDLPLQCLHSLNMDEDGHRTGPCIAAVGDKLVRKATSDDRDAPGAAAT